MNQIQKKFNGSKLTKDQLFGNTFCLIRNIIVRYAQYVRQSINWQGPAQL